MIVRRYPFSYFVLAMRMADDTRAFQTAPRSVVFEPEHFRSQRMAAKFRDSLLQGFVRLSRSPNGDFVFAANDWLKQTRSPTSR